ncbi:hypothetical protein [Polaribacter sp. IC063]|uniref:hypothetical protein n=1 Tax=Polaribacter sp. IC063 TaxID=57031 RepID=UPI001676C4F5|nr:hypothetical protein [Polaribacter sp. IC063]
MQIERTNNEILIKIPSDAVCYGGGQRILDYLKFREIASKSKASQKQIDEISTEINNS